MVGKLRDGHDEHDPQRKRARAVLQPRAALDEKRRDGAGKEQRQTAVDRMVGDAVVGVGEVPEAVAQDSSPQHVRPDHVTALVLRDEDAKPAADGDDIQDAGDAVHDVPRARDGPQVVDGGAVPCAVREHLEIAENRLADVDCQDERRKAERPLLLVEPVDLPVRTASVHEAQRHKADATC